MSNINKEIGEYIESSKDTILATVDFNNSPNLRVIGGFGIDDAAIYFTTAKDTNKVEHIKGNNNISIIFQHENQVIPNFINVEVKGVAEELESKGQFEEGFKFIAKRRPQLKVTEKTHNIYKIIPSEIKILDFTKENPDKKIQIIKFK
ncbi:pyridoxamine 5'-phosphate oxidase-related FMN-binding protein [Clostridium sp. DL-VIII]|uniref:pyridoxamine 5'-phosphate oxidase family protein n=1 Tax=Clostridium sp. DL-VIII TaxID=641107 RepID=UPI00023AF3BF|nr:pyridoxamine 5'-phosphate oxidase family protein [Clostridium sp. DL-VIII]EHI97192.1 pyridoxamine 5'-phosphate oxidase-related FMN-binding protein [Clostridium sp. DL-VIII]